MPTPQPVNQIGIADSPFKKIKISFAMEVPLLEKHLLVFLIPLGFM
jgi:hypothetical protein